MLNIIKDTYKLFFQKFPIWVLFVLPLMVYSFGDDYLRGSYADCRSYLYLSLCLSPLVFTVVEVAIYKYVLKAELGRIWGFVKKWLLFAVIQFVMGFVMMVPMFILSKIVAHHSVSIYWVPLGLIINIFLGIWLFAKVNVLLPMIIKGDKITVESFNNMAKGSYLAWLLPATLVYFPYVASYYLIGDNTVNIVVTSLLAVLQCLFNCLYYENKQK